MGVFFNWLGQGDGDALEYPKSVVFDASNQRLLVGDLAAQAVLAIDPVTGNRSYFSKRQGSYDRHWVRPSSAKWKNGNLLVADAHQQSVFVFKPDQLEAEVLYDERAQDTDVSIHWGALALAESANRLYLAGGLNGNIIAVDLNTVNATVIADAETGTGPALSYGLDFIHWDEASQRLFYCDSLQAQLVSVNVETKERRILASAQDGGSPSLENPEDFAFDQEHILLLDDNGDFVIRVHKTTGERTVLSSFDDSVGQGETLQYGEHVGIDRDRQRLLVNHPSSSRVSAVDLKTGNRTNVLTEEQLTRGPSVHTPNATFDVERDRAFLWNSEGVYVLDLLTGDTVYLFP